MKSLSISEEILLKYFKTPFDEDDAQKIVNSENAVKSCTEVTIIWAMIEAAELLDEAFGGRSCAKAMKGLLDGSIELNQSTEEEEEEDLL